MTRALVCLLLALSACGDDSGGGGGEADGPIGDPADAFVETADAPVGPTADAPVNPPTADARTDIPGLDQACTCDPSTACMEGLVCYVNAPAPPHFLQCAGDAGASESGVCRPRTSGTCEATGSECPYPSDCINFTDGMGVCAPANGDDQPCRPERCADGLVCVGPDDDNRFCREICTSQDDCEANETCTPLSSGMACLPNG